MGFDVLPGDVRHEGLVAVALRVEDEAALALLPASPNRFAPRNSPSSSGMLKRGRPLVASSSVRDMSWMPSGQSSMIASILAMRVPAEFTTSSAQRGWQAQVSTVKTIAWKASRNPGRTDS